MTSKPIICLTGKTPTKLESTLGVIALEKKDQQTAKKLLFGGKEISRQNVIDRIIGIVNLVVSIGGKAVLLNCDNYIVCDLEKALLSKGVAVCYPYYQKQTCIIKENNKYISEVRMVEKAIIKKTRRGITVIQPQSGKRKKCVFEYDTNLIKKSERKDAGGRCLKVSLDRPTDFDLSMNISDPLVGDQCAIREALSIRDARQAPTIPERAEIIATIVRDYKADSILLDLPIYIIRETEDAISQTKKNIMYYQTKKNVVHDIVIKD